MNKLYFFYFIFSTVLLRAQDASELKWWDPMEHSFTVLEGQAWSGEVALPYDRLPSRAKDLVREPVWDLSRHSSGLMIRFRSNAPEISIRYRVTLEDRRTHMPRTGSSGLDLYAIDSDGNWMWCRPGRSFQDTIVYRYTGLRPNDLYHDRGREYRLYLPLYNQVEWLEIGVPEETYFEALPVRMEKPIVVYGTSIAHGASASRPGMAWANIMSRKMDRPLINLAFSGNGRLEVELTRLLTEIDAKIYVLDCLPNLWRPETYDDTELMTRVLNSVRLLRESRPATPILLTAHAGYTDGLIQSERQFLFERVNRIQEEAFAKLVDEGITKLYYLTNDELGLQLDDMVDGTHPNDLGMMRYANSYEEKLREILAEPIGTASTTQACIQYREPGNYDWEVRHRMILEKNRTDPPKTVILANSIIHFWGGQPRLGPVREEASWSEIFTPAGLGNYAFGWDRIENVLWRVYHGELDGFEAEKIIVMIGTNNLHLNSDEEIIKGLDYLTKAIQDRQPAAQLYLMGLLPRRDYESRIASLNKQIARFASTHHARYRDPGTFFLEEDGRVEESLFSDGLHPNETGYHLLRKVFEPLIRK